MKLFLTSSCVSENLREDFLKEFGKDPKSCKLYFVPTASDVEDEKFYVCKSMDDLAVLGFNPIWYSLKFKNKETIQKELSDADIIWVNGGNTFYLLDTARKSGFLDVVYDLVVNKGVAYGGTSAGTILASKNIESAGWKLQGDSNDVGVSDLSSLSFVDFTSFVHFDKSSHEEGILQNKKEGETVYAIPNGGMIVYDDNSIRTYGDVSVYK